MNDTPKDWSKRFEPSDTDYSALLNRPKAERAPSKLPAILSALGILIVFMFFTWPSSSLTTGGTQPETTKTAAEAEADLREFRLRNHKLDLDKLQISKENWTTGGFGTVMMYDFSVTNNADAPMKDLQLECTTYGASGTKLNTLEYTLYEKIPEGKTRTFRDLNIGFIDGQSARAHCVITGAVKGY